MVKLHEFVKPNSLTMWPQKEVFVTNTCTDHSLWPSIDILINDYWFEFHPKDYLLDATHNKDKSACEIAFVANTSEFWLLGDSFYRGYYMIHDEENERLGIAPHATSIKRDIEEISPEQPIKGDDLTA